MMKFKGGIHPAYHKLTADSKIIPMPLLPRYVIPLSQHIGAPGDVIVERGQEVKRGQPLTSPAGFVSVAVHAPTSGKIKKIGDFPHPLGKAQPGIEITPDGEDTWYEGVKGQGEWRKLEPGILKDLIRDGGLVGLGGASFPTHVKLSPPLEKSIDLLILNGAECEPYLTSDHRVMLENAPKVMEGIGLLMKVLGVEKAQVGIESNKADAKEAMENSCPVDLDIEVSLVETKYPQGSEKHLIYTLTGRKVPPGGLPMDVGVVVQNVGTALSCLEAVEQGRPLTERVVTVTGSAISRPANLMVRVGTPVSDVIDFCGGLTGNVGKVIFGGPMMGIVQFNLNAPVLKGTSGILCLEESEVSLFQGEPCIRCGNCVDACPMFLVPSAMGLLVERNRFEDLGEYHISDCIECGSCAYVCLSHRPLVQFFKRGKIEWRELLKKLEESSS
jgi:Na+-translocating ferredoxin:NAD+ oxidoreductase subunit C